MAVRGVAPDGETAEIAVPVAGGVKAREEWKECGDLQGPVRGPGGRARALVPSSPVRREFKGMYPMHHEQYAGRRRAADDKGIALLVALAVVAILAVVVFDFSFSTRVDMRIAANFRDRLVALEAAKAGVQYGIYMLRQDTNVRQDNLQDDWAQLAGIVLDKTDPYELAELAGLTEEELGLEKHEDYLARQEGGNVPTASILIVDEERKIGVNFLAGRGVKPMYRGWIENLIENLQENPYFPEVDAYELVESITDWIDTDDTGHAESTYYEDLDVPYSCRNGPMESIYELKLVKDMTDLLFFGDTPYPMQLSGLEEDQWEERDQLGYTLPEAAPWEREEDLEAVYGLVNFLTAHSSGRINLNTAPPEVLLAMFGNDETLVEDVLRTREEIPLQGKEIQGILGPDLYNLLVSGSVITFASSYFRIESTGKFHKAAVKVTAIVFRSTTRDIAIHYWRVEDVRPDSSSDDVAWINAV